MNMNIDMFRSLAEQMDKRSRFEQWEEYLYAQLEKGSKKPGYLATELTGLDVQNQNSGRFYRIYHSSVVDGFVEGATTLEIAGERAVITKIESYSLFDEDDSVQSTDIERIFDVADIDALISAFKALDVCSKPFPKDLGLDGTNWIVESSDEGNYCYDSLWSNAHLLLPVRKEVDRLIAKDK